MTAKTSGYMLIKSPAAAGDLAARFQDRRVATRIAGDRDKRGKAQPRPDHKPAIVKQG